MAKLAVYRILTLDVWGNEEDGWDTNAVCNTNQTVDIDFESDASIVNALNAVEIFNNVGEFDVDIDGDANMLYISNADNGRPLLHLEFVEGI